MVVKATSERFLAFLELGPFPEARSDLGHCWFWTGARLPKGYGRFRANGKLHLAHRYSYRLFRAEPNPLLTLDHLCCVTSCANPFHVEEVPGAVNVYRGKGPSAEHARQTHCVNGHEFTPDNTYDAPGGKQRQCRTCTRTRHQKYALRRKT